MCDECDKLDKKIGHYRSLMVRVMDPLTNEGLGKLIERRRRKKQRFIPSKRSNLSLCFARPSLLPMCPGQGRPFYL